MKPLRITDRPTTVNTGNIISRLRRIRQELGMLMQQVDDALARLEAERKNA